MADEHLQSRVGAERVDEVADELCRFVDAAPSPFHAVARAAAALDAAGFTRLQESDAWARGSSGARRYVVRGGSLVAWSTEWAQVPHAPFRVLAAHSDSPTLRIRPNPDLHRYGWDLLGVEVYGSPLLNSWLDRDLGLSGRVLLRPEPGTDPAPVERLVRIDDPLLRVAQLAVHLDRAVNSEGVRLNPQTQLVPLWGTGATAPAFRELLAQALEVAVGDVLAWDVMTHDLTPARRLGVSRDLVAASRLDNLCSCHAAIAALVAALGEPERGPGDAGAAGTVPVVVLFDHEEIGSLSDRGGHSSLLPTILERIVLAGGGTREDLMRASAASLVVSTDMAHAVHPNYGERHEPEHAPQVNAGPVLKVNAQGRYASDAPGIAALQLAADRSGVPLQRFVSRGDMPCGSTIGPMTAALTGMTTVDVGVAMLSMHSARELCGAADPVWYLDLLSEVLVG